jgi:hypothetical protein
MVFPMAHKQLSGAGYSVYSSTFNRLTPASRRVSLHEEGGQKEDINSHIRYFVNNAETER